MAYQKIGFKNGNVLTAEQLIHMEDGIINAEKKAGAGTPGAGTPGGTGTGLPSDVGAYKYMATDGEGQWKPVDRLAYNEVSQKELFNQTVAFTFDSEDNVARGPDGTVSSFGKIVIGEKYTVVWDGVEFPDLTAFDDDGPTIGAPYGSWADELPFSIYTYEGNVVTHVGFGTNSTAESHTISISQMGKNIKKIDDELIPENIVRVYEGRETIVPETQLSFFDAMYGGHQSHIGAEYMFCIVSGETYVVTLDDVEYRLVAQGDASGDTDTTSDVYLGDDVPTISVPMKLGFSIGTTLGTFLLRTNPDIITPDPTTFKLEKVLQSTIPAEYLPRIVFTYDGTNYTCNVPYAEFKNAISNGLPVIYVDKHDTALPVLHSAVSVSCSSGEYTDSGEDEWIIYIFSVMLFDNFLNLKYTANGITKYTVS